ncbi:MAG TPA: PorV/PorQ family protein [Edaphocola sp.]|nr:PorV/PorQ family protein [Edaphocola sp.]
MKFNLFLIALIGWVFFNVNIAKAQSRIYVNEYLNIGVGARALAMGGAQTASSADAYATYWNPAGLVNMENNAELGLMHAEYFAGIFKYEYGSLGMKLKDSSRAVGLSFLRFATDNIPYTIDYVRPDGSFDESKLKSISAGDYAFNISYAQKLKWFKKQSKIESSIGTNVKIIYRNVGKMSNAWGAGLDIGLNIHSNKWMFGVNAKDITTTTTAWNFNFTEREKQIFQQTDNKIPIKSYEVMYPRLNIAYGRYFLNPRSNIQILGELATDITTDGKRLTLISNDQISIDPRIGFEISYKKNIFLRAGLSNFYQIKNNKDTLNLKDYWIYQPSIGTGFKINQLHIDYAFTSLNMQDNPLFTHIVSLKLDFNKKRKKIIEGSEIENQQIIQIDEKDNSK